MLSESATIILGLIAAGRSYDQILQQHPHLTYFDIFAAAREALRLHEEAPSPPVDNVSLEPTRKRKTEIVERAREKHPRAYERWTDEEDQRLTLLFHEGRRVTEIARTLERQRGAISSRLLKLGLIVRNSNDEPTASHLVFDTFDEDAADHGQTAVTETTVVPGWGAFHARLIDAPQPGCSRGATHGQ